MLWTMGYELRPPMTRKTSLDLLVLRISNPMLIIGPSHCRSSRCPGNTACMTTASSDFMESENDWKCERIFEDAYAGLINFSYEFFT
jgi:hypothetical protein